MIDETRIERALRQGPPFRTHYVQQSLPISLQVDSTVRAPRQQGASRPAWALSWALIVGTLMLAVVIGGATLIGSGVIKLPVKPPVVPDASPSPSATAVPSADPNDSSAWIATGRMVLPRSEGHTVTLLADGRVLVAGGVDHGSRLLVATELFDPATRAWTSTGEMTQARWGHTATLLLDGTVLVVGGGDMNGNGRTFRSAELYDPATGRWTPTGEMTQTRTGHSATRLPDGRVLVAGGHTGAGNGWLDSVELYDPATGTWTSTKGMLQARGSHTATLLHDGRVLVVGGVVGGIGCCTPLSSAELFDPQTGSWTAAESLPDLRGGSNAVLLLDGRVLVAGEINGGVTPTAELYDPVSGSWSPGANMIAPRMNATVTLLPNGQVLFAGGTLNHDPYVLTGLATTEIYDPATGKWITTLNMIASRGEGQVAVSLADGRVLLIGGMASMDGRDGPTVFSDPAAEVYDLAGGG